MKNLILACFLLIPGIVSATEQIPDELDIDGAKFSFSLHDLLMHGVTGRDIEHLKLI